MDKEKIENYKNICSVRTIPGLKSSQGVSDK
jgi:hypothetical protein